MSALIQSPCAVQVGATPLYTLSLSLDQVVCCHSYYELVCHILTEMLHSQSYCSKESYQCLLTRKKESTCVSGLKPNTVSLNELSHEWVRLIKVGVSIDVYGVSLLNEPRLINIHIWLCLLVAHRTLGWILCLIQLQSGYEFNDLIDVPLLRISVIIKVELLSVVRTNTTNYM